MFSISTVASSTRMPTASARPPRVMMLMVSPSAASISSEQMIDNGIETAMMMVERQLPRKMRIIAAVRQAAMIASRTTPLIAARTKRDWSAMGVIRRLGGSCAWIDGSCARTLAMMSRVEDFPVFWMLSSEERCPSTRTMFVCGGNPSRTLPMSRMYVVAPLTVLMGRLLRAAIEVGALLVSTG